jgi:hypothetical protein
MKKTKIGRRMLDVVNEQEYIRRTTMNPSATADLAEDTAIEKDGYVYPVTKQYSPIVPGVTDVGPVLLYSHPEEMNDDPEYDSKNTIDFSNVKNLQESIEKQAELMKSERAILVSPDNIFTPMVKEEDTPEMKLLKEAIVRKNIDLDNYKQRFGSDYNNDKRLFDQNSITFFKMKRICDIMDIKMSLTLEDKPGAANPIGDKLSAQITMNEE